MTIKIIDLYSGNSPVDFVEIAKEYQGVIFKAGQGGWADVPRYKSDWWLEAGEAGLLRGWYWLVDSRYSLQHHKDEFRNWFKDYSALNNELGFWVDVEKPMVSMTDAQYWKTPYAGAQHVKNFCGFLQGLGVKPGIYTSPGAFQLILSKEASYFSQFPLWTAQYPYIYIPGVSKPTLYGMWKKWVFWQYREGPDVNIFNGTKQEFEALFGTEGETMGTTGKVIAIRGAKVRPQPSTNNTAIGALVYNTALEIVEIKVVKAGWEEWARITKPIAGWIAVIYGGNKIVEVAAAPEPAKGERRVHIVMQEEGYPDFIVDEVWKPNA